MYLHVTEDMRIRDCPQYRKGFCRLGESTELRVGGRLADSVHRTGMSSKARPSSRVSGVPRRILYQRTRVQPGAVSTVSPGVPTDDTDAMMCTVQSLNPTQIHQPRRLEFQTSRERGSCQKRVSDCIDRIGYSLRQTIDHSEAEEVEEGEEEGEGEGEEEDGIREEVVVGEVGGERISGASHSRTSRVQLLTVRVPRLQYCDVLQGESRCNFTRISH
jgi:hypothetical protein